MATVSAVFRNGAFVPDHPPPIPEGTKVELQVLAIPPEDGSSTCRERMRSLVNRMKSRALDESALPLPLSRDDLHERR